MAAGEHHDNNQSFEFEAGAEVEFARRGENETQAKRQTCVRLG